MKKSLLIAALITLPLSTPLAWAVDTHHSDMDQPMQMGKMQENMLMMHEKMHQIMVAKNPQERASLMQEHTKMMQENMRMMHGMKSGEMMDHGLRGGDAKDDKMDGGMKSQ